MYININVAIYISLYTKSWAKVITSMPRRLEGLDDLPLHALSLPRARALVRVLPVAAGQRRALAEISMHRERSTLFLSLLLLLKALMTAAAIGSGAAGGTLTPSVALGATLGAILGEVYQLYLPQWAPGEDQDSRMSVVAAAAFLSVAMNSPAGGLELSELPFRSV